MRKDTYIGIGAILVGIFFFYNTQSINVPANLGEPGPRVLPYIAELMMIVCGGGIIYESLKDKNEETAFLTKAGWKKLGIIFSLLVAYAIALKYVGFIFATPLVFATLMQMLNSEKNQTILKSVILSIILTGIIYILFAKGFMVSLPKGILF